VKATKYVQTYSRLRPVEHCPSDADRNKIAVFTPPNFLRELSSISFGAELLNPKDLARNFTGNEKCTMFADITTAPFFLLAFSFISRPPKFGWCSLRVPGNLAGLPESMAHTP
jgi:hypothetical protein